MSLAKTCHFPVVRQAFKQKRKTEEILREKIFSLLNFLFFFFFKKIFIYFNTPIFILSPHKLMDKLKLTKLRLTNMIFLERK